MADLRRLLDYNSEYSVLSCYVQETATMKAFVRYYVSFTANKQGLSGEVEAYLQAEVGNDSCVYNVYPG